jgi:hypothetical protein
MADATTLNEKLFNILLGAGHKNILLYTDEGKMTTDPKEASRMFLGVLKIMVNISETDSGDEIIVNLSRGTNISGIRRLLTRIKNLATENIAEYTVRTLGKEITPKDFAYQASQQVSEGFDRWHGSPRRSYQRLPNARIVVNHSKSVDPEARGGRTRQIESIFIENASGERFKFPSKNITAARAMTKHVNEGGTPFDEFGSHIYGVMEELTQLKKFQRHNNRQDFFEDAAISEEIQSRVTNLRSSLKQISGPKGYKHHFESFSNDKSDVPTEQLDELRDTVTVRSFDENIAESLPYVARIIEAHKGKTTANGLVGKFAKHVLNNANSKFEITGDIDDSDSPKWQTFSDETTEVKSWIDFLLHMVDDDIEAKLADIDKVLGQVSDTYKTMLLRAIKVITSNTMEMATEDCDCHSIDDAINKDLKESMAQYTAEWRIIK